MQMSQMSWQAAQPPFLQHLPLHCSRSRMGFPCHSPLIHTSTQPLGLHPLKPSADLSWPSLLMLLPPGLPQPSPWAAASRHSHPKAHMRISHWLMCVLWRSQRGGRARPGGEKLPWTCSGVERDQGWVGMSREKEQGLRRAGHD